MAWPSAPCPLASVLCNGREELVTVPLQSSAPTENVGRPQPRRWTTATAPEEVYHGGRREPADMTERERELLAYLETCSRIIPPSTSS